MRNEFDANLWLQYSHPEPAKSWLAPSTTLGRALAQLRAVESQHASR